MFTQEANCTTQQGGEGGKVLRGAEGRVSTGGGETLHACLSGLLRTGPLAHSSVRQTGVLHLFSHTHTHTNRGEMSIASL